MYKEIEGINYEDKKKIFQYTNLLCDEVKISIEPWADLILLKRKETLSVYVPKSHDFEDFLEFIDDRIDEKFIASKAQSMLLSIDDTFIAYYPSTFPQKHD